MFSEERLPVEATLLGRNPLQCPRKFEFRLIKQDGLYMNGEQNRVIEWFWNYLPFSSYAE